MKMLKHPDLTVLEKLSVKTNEAELDLIFQSLFNEMKIFLEREPFQKNIKIIIRKETNSKKSTDDDIFKIGVIKYIKNNFLIIEIYKDYLKFIPFIILREIYNSFIPDALKEFESIQLVLNQIILTDLNKFSSLNEWRTLIRGKIEQYDHFAIGFNRLIIFDRLEKFFHSQKKEDSHNPKKFFFQYILRNKSIITDKMDDFYEIFLQEFTKFVSKSINNDEIVETIRLLIIIFYKFKIYNDFSSYKILFQKLKESGDLKTELSLRKFIRNMDWIKNYSYIAPSYKLNWQAINVCVIAVFLQFNPILKRSEIYKVIESCPFFTSSKISNESFAIELSGYFILPRIYLDDFINLIKRMISSNYIVKYHCLLRTSQNHILNLNYFREYSQKYRMINPNHRAYHKKYVSEFQIDFGDKFLNPKLSLLEFLIIDRVRFFSFFGFGFERRTETLNVLKSDLINEIVSQRTIITNLNRVLNNFYVSENLKSGFLQFLNKNIKFGFFSIKKMLEEYLSVLSLTEGVIAKNSQVKSFESLYNIIKNQYQSRTLKDIIILNNIFLDKTSFEEIISIFSESKEVIQDKIKKYKNFYKLINAFYNLKLFNLNSIRKIIVNKELVDKIFSIKENKLENLYEKFKPYQITNHEVNNILDKLLNNNPPIISPLLLNTINMKQYEGDYLQLILKDSKITQKILKQINFYFPRLLINQTKDLISNENQVYVEISTPYLTKKEKGQLLSTFYNLFKDNLVFGKFFLWSGMIKGFSSKNFYDFDKEAFFYTKDLYEQYFLYVRSVFGVELESCKEEKTENQSNLWSTSINMLELAKKVNIRIMQENCDYHNTYLEKLLEFHFNLKKSLLNSEKFKNVKKEYFFNNYIKNLNFIPLFEKFGLGQYYMYLYPTNVNELDFKLLFLNTFQKVKYPASIDTSNSFFIKYLTPYGSPNLKYLHWLARSKKIIREYCGFFINRVYKILHFNDNLNQEGWIYDKDKFKMHMQNVLFDPKYNHKNPIIKEFETGNKSISSYFGPETPEFKSLSQIYDTKSIDIKSYLTTKKVKTINHITSLLKKDLIFPYLTLKNLDLHNIVYIIVPNLKKELIETVVKVFSFFNVATIYEITGEYFIYGFDQEVQFPTGLMIKINFPKCEISEFERIFDLLFEYLEIKDYIILNDLIDGSNLIESVYGGLDFLKSYNPLKNLDWNEQQKRWENPKVFTSKFEPIYPDLNPKNKK